MKMQQKQCTGNNITVFLYSCEYYYHLYVVYTYPARNIVGKCNKYEYK